jgi:hypothetical protein
LGHALKVNRSAERIVGSDVTIVSRRSFRSIREGTRARAPHALISSPGEEALPPPIGLPRRFGRPILACLCARNGMAAFAPTPVVPEATSVVSVLVKG